MSKLQDSYLVDMYNGHVSEILREKAKDSTNKFMDYKTLLKMKR
jgi:hypothetical protein